MNVAHGHGDRIAMVLLDAGTPITCHVVEPHLNRAVTCSTFSIRATFRRLYMHPRSREMHEQLSSPYLHTGDSLSFQSNYTSSSRLSSPVGTGRTLSFACLRIGDWLEQLLLKVAHRRGLGTNAVYDHLVTNTQEILSNDCIWRPTGSAWANDSREDNIWHEFQKLLKYAGSNSTPTEYLALQHILDIVTSYPCIIERLHIQKVLNSMAAIRSHRSDQVSYSLQQKRILASNVELCFGENELAVTIKHLLSESNRDRCGEHIIQLLKLSKDPRLSYVALRYSNSALRHTLNASCCAQTDLQFWTLVYQDASEIAYLAGDLDDVDGVDVLLSTVLSRGENLDRISAEMFSAYRNFVSILLRIESSLPLTRAKALQQWSCISKIEMRGRIVASA